MTRHSLRIHVSPGTDTLQELTQQIGADAPVESCIVLEKDLAALCFALQIPATTTKGPFINILTKPGGEAGFQPDNFANRKARSMHLRCEIRDTVYRAIDDALQHKLLAPLAAIVAASQRVVFTGKICNLQEVESLRRRMSPGTMCQTAYYWACFEGIVKAKESVDAALEHDHLDFVLAMYVSMGILSLSLLRTEDVRREMKYNYPSLWGAMYVFNFELMIMIEWGKLKVQDLDGFCVHFEAARQFCAEISYEFDGSYDLMNEILPYYDCLYIWWYLYASEGYVKHLDPDTTTIASIASRLRLTAK
jgi:hypothetical protein